MRFALLAAFGSCAIVSTFTVAGCSDSTPVPQKGGFSVELSLSHDPKQSCDVGPVNADLGSVTATNADGVETNGPDTTIDCSVTGKTTFDVEASANGKTGFLSVSIHGISSKSTMDNPAHGTVSFTSPSVGTNNYVSGPDGCDFWFEGSQQRVEGGSTGKIWALFKCDTVKDSIATCSIDDGVIVFENCETTSPSSD